MTSESGDIETVRAIYPAMAAGDIAKLFEYIDPECVIVQDERLPWGGRHVGHEGFATFGLRLRENIASTVTTSAMFAADGDVIQVGKTAGTTIVVRDGLRHRRGPSWSIFATVVPSPPTSRSTRRRCSTPSAAPADAPRPAGFRSVAGVDLRNR